MLYMSARTTVYRMFCAGQIPLPALGCEGWFQPIGMGAPPPSLQMVAHHPPPLPPFLPPSIPPSLFSDIPTFAVNLQPKRAQPVWYKYGGIGHGRSNGFRPLAFSQRLANRIQRLKT